MPVYEYECRSCGTVTDVRHGFDETVSEACPACGGELTRRFSAAGIVFKGSGFYITDSRKAGGGNSTPAPKQESAPKSDSAATPPKKGDSSAA